MTTYNDYPVEELFKAVSLEYKTLNNAVSAKSALDDMLLLRDKGDIEIADDTLKYGTMAIEASVERAKAVAIWSGVMRDQYTEKLLTDQQIYDKFHESISHMEKMVDLLWELFFEEDDEDGERVKIRRDMIHITIADLIVWVENEKLEEFHPEAFDSIKHTHNLIHMYIGGENQEHKTRFIDETA